MNCSFLAPTAFTAAFVLACPLAAQPLSPAEQVIIDTLVTETLAETNVPAAPTKVELLRPPRLRGGFVNRVFRVRFADDKTMVISTYADPGANGRWEQFIV